MGSQKETEHERDRQKMIDALVQKQRDFFYTHVTLDVEYRIKYLKKLYRVITKYEKEILAALKSDLGKCDMEGYMCEVGLTLAELSHQLKHIRKWTKKKHYKTDITNAIARSYSIREPYGVVLVMSPWNYPFMLTMEPVIGAIAAGNTCVIKPSAYAPATSQIIADIISEAFPKKYAAVVQGGREENAALLEQRFDYIFFTGGVTVGKLVMEKAAANLTPITLELGGKSPCVVTKDANLKIAAKRVVFGKYLNCGQTCVAPDYLLIDKKIRDEFVELLKKEITAMYTEKPLENSAYGKIVNRKHFERLKGLISTEKVVAGGEWNDETLQIAPTVLIDVTAADAVMQEEIFGPILPILTYENLDEVEDFILEREKPLAFYLFTEDKSVQKRFMNHISFGGGCINDTVMHLTSSEMGFGGVGHSGMGSYHGRKSFECFTHEKSILDKVTWIDVPIRYQPHKKSKWMLMKQLLLFFFPIMIGSFFQQLGNYL